MSDATPRLSNALQTLVDNRLDAIEQNLLRAGVPRHQRQSIVEEVENQILEMLSRRGTEELTRQDVLAVLAQLDPPEAYVPEDAPGRPIAEPAAASAESPSPGPTPVATTTRLVQTVRERWQPGWLACFATGLGLFTLLLTLVFSFSGMARGESMVVFLFLMILAATSTLIGGLALYYLRREADQRTLLGVALFATLLYPMLMLDGLLLLIGALTYPVSIGLLVLAAFAGVNGAASWYAWRWAATKPVARAETKPAASSPLIITG